MKYIYSKIDDLVALIKSYENDDLSLNEIISMEATFEGLIIQIRDFKNEIIDSRFVLQKVIEVSSTR